MLQKGQLFHNGRNGRENVHEMIFSQSPPLEVSELAQIRFTRDTEREMI